MIDAKLPVFRTAFVSWRDGLAALRSMPAMAVIVFVVIAVDSATDNALRLAAPAQTIVPLQVLRLAVSVALLSVVLTPAAIAINRYVLLGETTRRYALDIASPRFRRFCRYSALVTLLLLIPMMVAEVAMDIYINVAVVVLVLIAIAVLVVTWILFPAIAVDAPGASLRNAVQDTHFFRALAISAVTFLPALVFGILIAIWWEETSSGSTLGWILYVVFEAAVSGITFAALNAMSSHLYRAWAVRLQQPAGGVI